MIKTYDHAIRVLDTRLAMRSPHMGKAVVRFTKRNPSIANTLRAKFYSAFSNGCRSFKEYQSYLASEDNDNHEREVCQVMAMFSVSESSFRKGLAKNGIDATRYKELMGHTVAEGYRTIILNRSKAA